MITPFYPVKIYRVFNIANILLISSICIQNTLLGTGRTHPDWHDFAGVYGKRSLSDRTAQSVHSITKAVIKKDVFGRIFERVLPLKEKAHLIKGALLSIRRLNSALLVEHVRVCRGYER